jgi:hypothetical protein
MQNPMIDPSLITKDSSTSRVLFADDLGSSDKNLISLIFRKYGKVEFSSRRMQDQNGNFKLYGYIIFEKGTFTRKML